MDKHGEIVIYKKENGSDDIEVKLENNTVWLNQEQLVSLYNSSKSNISEHIKHILEDGELNENSTVRFFRTVASNGKNYNVKYYNLDMIIAIGLRVKSNIGTNFRIWANERLSEYITKGYTLNDDLLKRAGGGIYFDELLSRIRDIRSSEKVFWRKILDIYSTSVDYDPKNEISVNLFKNIQNKIHYASHGHTAAEILYDRADSTKDFMGMTNFVGNYPTLHEATIAKNYLNEKELDILNRIVSMYLDYAELQAIEHNVMTMQNWSDELDYFLKMNRKDLLTNNGTISHKVAIEHVKEEYSKFKYRLDNSPSNVEKAFLDNLNELTKIENKK